MQFNWIAVIIATIIPTIVGFVYYHPKVLGNAWMQASGVTEESARAGNMPLIFGVSFVLSLLLSIEMNFIAIHQWHLMSLLANDPGVNDPTTPVGQELAALIAKYGDNFRTFKHGALHGALAGLFFALPILGTSALFERKSFKYIGINVGYWVITLALMGGVLCSMR